MGAHNYDWLHGFQRVTHKAWMIMESYLEFDMIRMTKVPKLESILSVLFAAW